MKVLSVVGFTQSGKTTTIEKIIIELRKRNYTVGSLKDIHYEEFQMDTDGTNTDRHRKAGSQLVAARGRDETDILYSEHLDIYRILNFFDQDYIILEGVNEGNFPKIIAAKDIEGIEGKLDEKAILVSGRIADQIEYYKDLEAISCKEIDRLVDFIEENTFEVLPNYTKKCCGLCGLSCEEMCVDIVNKRKTRHDCIIHQDNISLAINDHKIEMVPFVQDILRNNVMAIVKELDGYKKGHKITIDIGYSNENNDIDQEET